MKNSTSALLYSKAGFVCECRSSLCLVLVITPTVVYFKFFCRLHQKKKKSWPCLCYSLFSYKTFFLVCSSCTDTKKYRSCYPSNFKTPRLLKFVAQSTEAEESGSCLHLSSRGEEPLCCFTSRKDRGRGVSCNGHQGSI
jgi:hypothetical protein